MTTVTFKQSPKSIALAVTVYRTVEAASEVVISALEAMRDNLHGEQVFEDSPIMNCVEASNADLRRRLVEGNEPHAFNVLGQMWMTLKKAVDEAYTAEVAEEIARRYQELSQATAERAPYSATEDNEVVAVAA